MYEHNEWKMWFETDPPREAGTAPGSPPPKRARRPAPQQDIGRRVFDLSPEGRWYYYEGPKGHEKVYKMVDMVDMPGYEKQQLRTTFYKGERRNERKVREEYANGTVATFEGEQGKEALRTATELIEDDDDDESKEKKITFYQGEREHERKVREEWSDGTVMTYEGERGKEALRTLSSIYKKGRKLIFFAGERFNERQTRTEFEDGTVEIFEGERGEEALRQLVTPPKPPIGKRTETYEGPRKKEALRRVTYTTDRGLVTEIWGGKKRHEYKIETRYEDGTVERHSLPNP